jgi:S-adenosylmethionine decarboxylase
VSGIEWLVEAFGCSESALRDVALLADLFRDIVAEMSLKPLGDPVWHSLRAQAG